MMKTLNRWLVAAGLVLGAAPVLAAGGGHAHAKAHAHGVVQLEVALDGAALSIALAAPLDSLLGFERAPRTAAEKQAAQDALTALRGSALFTPDPAAGCVFQTATAEADALQPGAKGGEHADLDATATFTCTRPAQLRRIDLNGLLTRFPRIQRLQAQIVTPQGQFQQTLKRPAQTLTWGR